MHAAHALLMLAASATACFAQVGVGEIWYEASPDEGQTWQRNYLFLTPDVPSVLVRVRASWSADAGMYAFAGAQFDVLITDALADSVTDMERPWPMWTGSTQTLAATSFGSDIKIDDQRDTLPPGTGPRGVFPAQLTEQFAHTNFTSDNPVSIFQFRLTFGDFTIRRLSSLYIAPTGGDTISRYMRVYSSSIGEFITPTTTTHAITIDNYTPAPGGALCLALAGLGGCATRRRKPWKSERSWR